MKKNIAFIIIPIILFMFIAFFIGVEWMTNFESWVYLESVEHMSPFTTFIVKFVTHIGDSITVIAICLALFAIPYLRKSYAIPTSISVMIATVLNVLLKEIFSRPRPDILRLVNETSYSFPSGHAMVSMALYASLALLVLKLVSGTKTKVISISLCMFLALAIGFSRVFLGVHYITDVVGGWCLGFVIAFVVNIVYLRKWKEE